MKHTNYFNDFLRDHINLDDTRLKRLENSVQAVTNFLKNNLEGYTKYSLQGSYAHKTIIKPVQENDEFDADIQIYIKDVSFNPGNTGDKYIDYVDQIYSTLKEDGNYKGKLQKKTKCVTINYAGDFHLDVVPCIEHDSNVYICNSQNSQKSCYEKTDGEGYKSWLLKKNRDSGSNNLRKVIRILKFLRDHKSNFSVKSILLTSLLGEKCIQDGYESTEQFEDLPHALYALSERLDSYLQCNHNMPTVHNPVLPEEDFNKHWDQIKYSNFREKFNIYFKRIEKAINEKNFNKSIILWRELFGDSFGKLQSKKTTAAGIGGLLSVAATKPYARTEKPQQRLVEGQAASPLQLQDLMKDENLESQIEKIQSYFPGLYYDAETNSIKGELSFTACYYDSEKKKRKKGSSPKYKIRFCKTSEDGCIVDCYKIEIQLGQNKWTVREVDDRIKNLAKKQDKTLADLHLYENETCCLGLFLHRSEETISEFICLKVFPYFVWQAYYEKYNKIPPCGELGHDQKGEADLLEYSNNLSVNNICLCGSNHKIKKCCGIEKNKEFKASLAQALLINNAKRKMRLQHLHEAEPPTKTTSVIDLI